jgi:hypothetical protein
MGMPSRESFSCSERKPKIFWIDNTVLDQYVPKIGPYGFLVYCALVRKSENEVWTQAQIAQEIRCGISAVREAIDILVDVGLVWVRLGKKDGDLNIYGVQEVPAVLPSASQGQPAKSNLIEIRRASLD